MSGVETVAVTADEAGVRLDRWFRRHYPQVPHGRLEKWLRSGQVRLDGRRVKANARLEAGQTIRVPPLGDAPASRSRPRPAPRPAPSAAGDEAAKALAARILHRDDQVLVIDKPAGLAVQGGTGTHRHLDAMLDGLGFGGDRPRLVHRLDKDTSGVLVLARTAAAAAALTRAFRGREVRKLYWAVVVGVPRPAAGRLDLPLAKREGPHGEQMAPDVEKGLRAVTDYRTVERAGKRAAWLALEPLTGRTHQLRVHCVALGTPILGDRKYGGPGAVLEGGQLSNRLHLHARRIALPHPAGGTLVVTAPLPDHMRATWRFFGFAADEP
ncbi:MAG: RluA family pseudouridine synthase [Rhodospirillales bacterium]